MESLASTCTKKPSANLALGANPARHNDALPLLVKLDYSKPMHGAGTDRLPRGAQSSMSKV
jgi:hypothetical protein